MLDFITIKARPLKSGAIEVYPEYLVKRSKDLMIRGKAFYAIWNEETGFWSRSESDVQELIDRQIQEVAKEYEKEGPVVMRLLRKFSSRKWSEWQAYCKSLPDNYHELDEEVIFSNTKIKKTDYVSRQLPYPLEEVPTPAYDELIGTLYSEEERQKLEWAIGSIISGDSKRIQKFIVLYGGPGTGKSTMLNIIQDLFPGYYSVFESKALSSSNNAFALEAFRTNPLIAIQHDGDLSRIEDNTKLNSIVSHELMTVNEKFKATYSSKFNSFLFMGTNKPVKITDSKSGIIRRLIDVNPSGEKVSSKRYEELRGLIKFELGGIASHCLQVYKKLGMNHYDGYIPLSMIGATNDFYNFIEDNYEFFTIENPDGVSLKPAYLRYKEYCEEANVLYPYPKRLFKEELKSYFKEFYDRYGRSERNFYVGFLKEKLGFVEIEEKEVKNESWLKLDCTTSLLDDILKECPAQYAKERNKQEIPFANWERVNTTLSKIDTSKIHYVKVPENHIVIDFDLKGEDGEKSYERNLEAASKWPSTYAELSKGGKGIHLHYDYIGDPLSLSRIFSEDIEIKVFTGNSALRRKVTKCNDISVATISSGLPLKEVKSGVLKEETIQSERQLRALIRKGLKKEVWPNTRPSMDFIFKILEDSYNSGLKYDVCDLRPAIQSFALSSTNQSDYCMKLVSKMHFCSEEASENTEKYGTDIPIVFFDVEVFPNLFIIVWKKQGRHNNVVTMINPKPSEVEQLTKFKLVGFNNRNYDNHILYARMMGYTENQLYNLSQRIINNDRSAKFGEAYNLSYTDIYDFLSAANKMSLKKWEIKLGIHHQELGLPWDQPVDESLWKKVADYCVNDVIATEAVWDENQADWLARKILSVLSGLTVNDTTNNHTTRIIVGTDRNPQSQYIYTDLSTIFPGYEYNKFGIDKVRYNEGTKIVSGKSIYRGEDPGEGGYVYAEPGVYTNVALLDVASMHPHSAITLNIFGDKYTKRFKCIVEARVMIKHKDYESAKKFLEEILDSLDKLGVLDEYLNDPDKANQLADALKTAINSVYGLTSAKFENKLRDPKNEDNIVAKYGALFMINLKYEVQKRGYTVVHIKTDSIKIANADSEIISFVMNYGKEYGYTFEHEDTYSKICLVNDAVYIAKYQTPHKDKEAGNDIWWTATGTQFQIPYVFKTLFSGEPIEFKDLCETKSVSTALYLDFNERLSEEQHDYRFVGRVGQFCPILPGSGGGILLREGNGKFNAATGTKKPGKGNEVYRWMESEMVKTLGKEDQIDLSYYNKLVDDAVETISKYCDFEWFISEDDEIPFSEDFMNKPVTDAA